MLINNSLNSRLIYKKENPPRCICNEDIKKNELLLRFDINDCLISNYTLSQKINDTLGNNNIPIKYINYFTIAVDLFDNPDKICNLFEDSIENMTFKDKSFFLTDNQLERIKGYFQYYIIKINQEHFNNILNTYCNLFDKHDIINDSTKILKLKKLYCYVNKNSFNINLNDQPCTIISPAKIFNIKMTNNNDVILLHSIEDNIWSIYANKEYLKGEEIFECYKKINKYQHPLCENMFLEDWEFDLLMFSNCVLNNNQNNLDSKIYIENVDIIDKEKIFLFQKIYKISKEDLILLENLNKSTWNENDYLDELVIKLKIMEIECFYNFINNNKLNYN